MNESKDLFLAAVFLSFLRNLQENFLSLTRNKTGKITKGVESLAK